MPEEQARVIVARIIKHLPGAAHIVAKPWLYHHNRLNKDSLTRRWGETPKTCEGPPPMHDNAEGRGEELGARTGQETEGVHPPPLGERWTPEE